MRVAKFTDKEVYSTAFGRLKVLNIYSIKNINTGRSERRCFCVCECGEFFNGTKEKIVRGSTSSCGCLQKEHRKAFSGKMNERDNTYKTSFNEKYTTYKRRANHTGISFELTKMEFRELTSGDCYYCGVDALTNKNDTRRYEGRTYLCNGIDRIDSSLGYESGNCLPCCDICNRMKMAHSFNFFKNHILKLSIRVHKWDNL
jgi:hypothetical protein